MARSASELGQARLSLSCALGAQERLEREVAELRALLVEAAGYPLQGEHFGSWCIRVNEALKGCTPPSDVSNNPLRTEAQIGGDKTPTPTPVRSEGSRVGTGPSTLPDDSCSRMGCALARDVPADCNGCATVRAAAEAFVKVWEDDMGLTEEARAAKDLVLALRLPPPAGAHSEPPLRRKGDTPFCDNDVETAASGRPAKYCRMGECERKERGGTRCALHARGKENG